MQLDLHRTFVRLKKNTYALAFRERVSDEQTSSIYSSMLLSVKEERSLSRWEQNNRFTALVSLSCNFSSLKKLSNFASCYIPSRRLKHQHCSQICFLLTIIWWVSRGKRRILNKKKLTKHLCHSFFKTINNGN